MKPLTATMQLLVAEVEAEYSETFAQVVIGFAKDRESRRATAAILGTSETTFARVCRRLGIDAPWVEPTATLGWQNKAPAADNRARREAALRNLARANQINRLRYSRGRTKDQTDELINDRH